MRGELKKPIEYKYWAFRMLVYAVVLEVFILYKVTGHVIFFPMSRATSMGLAFAGLLSQACLLAGIPLIVLSYVKKEKQDTIFTLAFIGLMALNPWGLVLLLSAIFS